MLPEGSGKKGYSCNFLGDTLVEFLSPRQGFLPKTLRIFLCNKKIVLKDIPHQSGEGCQVPLVFFWEGFSGERYECSQRAFLTHNGEKGGPGEGTLELYGNNPLFSFPNFFEEEKRITRWPSKKSLYTFFWAKTNGLSPKDGTKRAQRGVWTRDTKRVRSSCSNSPPSTGKEREESQTMICSITLYFDTSCTGMLLSTACEDLEVH